MAKKLSEIKLNIRRNTYLFFITLILCTSLLGCAGGFDSDSKNSDEFEEIIFKSSDNEKSEE